MQFQEQIEELLQENDNYQDRIKRLQAEKIKVSEIEHAIIHSFLFLDIFYFTKNWIKTC